VTRAAVFLDRDGTIIRDVNYIADPARAELMPDAAAAIRRLNEAGWPVIVVTNQSGIARAMFTEREYEAVRRRIEGLLSAGGARVDATYMCPHHPEFTGPCACRKPGTLLFQRAATAHDLDLAASWYVGDKLRDLLPARALGGRGILIPTPATPASDLAAADAGFEVADSLDEAVTRVIESAK
jgi:D-glycero-D-manno-heptose 1,7-bisphosphate phosphatase